MDRVQQSVRCEDAKECGQVRQVRASNQEHCAPQYPSVRKFDYFSHKKGYLIQHQLLIFRAKCHESEANHDLLRNEEPATGNEGEVAEDVDQWVSILNATHHEPGEVVRGVGGDVHEVEPKEDNESGHDEQIEQNEQNEQDEPSSPNHGKIECSLGRIIFILIKLPCRLHQNI